MLANRSIAGATVIPVLAYEDVHQAAAWLCEAFGFRVRVRIGDHRVQLKAGEGAVTVREMRANEQNAAPGLAARSRCAWRMPMRIAAAPGSTGRGSLRSR